MSEITLGSLFSGIGGFEYAASLYGIKTVWASEIEDAPIRITKRHFPDMKHLGDITKINGAEIEPVDIITGGSPCQSLSTAGKKDGISVKCANCGNIIQMLNVDNDMDCCPECGSELEFTRSGLFMEQMRIIKEMRDSTNGDYPKIIVWENVNGALSSNNGDDFYVVLNEFCKLIGERVPKIRPEKWINSGEILGDHGSIAWRLMDAQYWGVPQRRKRIFLVADFRGQSASEILFKPESLRRHSAQSETPWKRTSGETGNSTECGDTSRKHLYNNVSHRIK